MNKLKSKNKQLPYTRCYIVVNYQIISKLNLEKCLTVLVKVSSIFIFFGASFCSKTNTTQKKVKENEKRMRQPQQQL